VRIAATVAVVAVGLAACSGSPNSPNAQKSGAAGYDPGYTCSKADCPTTLTASLAGGETTFVKNFNPFSPSATPGTFLMYEPLFAFNVLESGEFIPWLAESFEWSDDGSTITIHLADSATWNDGSPVTADDLVFTLEGLDADPELRRFDFTAVTAVDEKTATITFDGPAYTLENAIGELRVVPRTAWESQDLKTWTNPEPVASGPYTLGQFSSQQVTLEARADYWKQKVPVPQIRIPILGEAENQKLLSGELEWSGANIPNVQEVYVGKDPEHHHAYYPTYGTKNVFYNADRAPFDDAHVRKGLSLAVDGERIATVVTQNMTNTVNPTGMDPETQAKWIAPEYRDLEYGTADRAAALDELAKAGFEMQGDKLVGPDGEQLTVEIVENAAYGDAIQYDELVADDWKAIGVDASVRPVPGAELDAAKKNGDFDVNIGGAVYYQNPWGYYNDILHSSNAGGWANYGGWKDPATDDLLKKLARTGDEAEQMEVVAELQKLMVEQVPSFPVTSIGASTEYNTENWVGWPSEDDPYAVPPPWASPDNLRVVLSLRPNPDTYGD
jgi:peptide/nickel transport system substrate-binding protein